MTTNALDWYLKGDYIRVGELTRREAELDVKLHIDGYNGELKFNIDEGKMYLVVIEAKAEGDELTQSSMRICLNQGSSVVTIKGGESQKIYHEMYMEKGNHKMSLDLPGNIVIKRLEIKG